MKRPAPEQLRRPIDIVTLDLDTAGATFGQRATAALCAAGAPLSGLEIQFRSEVYDWNNVRKLVEIMNAAIARGAIVAALRREACSSMVATRRSSQTCRLSTRPVAVRSSWLGR